MKKKYKPQVMPSVGAQHPLICAQHPLICAQLVSQQPSAPHQQLLQFTHWAVCFMFYGVEYLSGQFGSAVLALFPPPASCATPRWQSMRH